jgi:molybdopterin-synthase adenylyltransferase
MSTRHRRQRSKAPAPKVADYKPMTTSNAVELVLPFGMWRDIREYLFTDLSREYACYLLCGHTEEAGRLRLLGCFLVLPQPEDYVRQSIASVQLSRSLLAEVLRECARHGLSLIDLHSHPFATDHVSFSSVDEADEREKAQWFSENVPNCFYGSVVLSQRNHEARIRSGKGRMMNAVLDIRPLETPLEPRSEPLGGGVSRNVAVDRHVRAFGDVGQDRMAAAHIGIVGLGGLGSGIALGLARLGVRKFTVVDHDRAERHNLNRIIGMRAHDARARTRKTKLIRRELLAIDPHIKCTGIAKSILEQPAWSTLLGCDLIVTATDNHSSRFLLNTLTEQYLIPQISVGSLIEAADHEIRSACGHVRVLLPGSKRPCLLCSQIINAAEVYYERVPDKLRREAVSRGYIANFEEPAPAVVHLNGVLINLALVEIHNLFCGFKEVRPYLFYDLLSQEILQINEGELECATCSPNGGYFGRGQLVSLAKVFEEMMPQ